MARDLSKRSLQQVMDAKKLVNRVTVALKRRRAEPSSEIQP